MNKKYIEMLESIGTITSKLNIAYSTFTGKFYLSTGLEVIINDGEYISSMAEHKDTPEKAIESYYNTLINATEGIYCYNEQMDTYKIFKWIGKEFELASHGKGSLYEND